MNKLKSGVQRDERTLLFEAIPSLQNLIGDHTTIDENCQYGHEAASQSLELSDSGRAQRFNYIIRKFVSVITDLGDPIILLLDDMQVRVFWQA